ncbi:MAG TPA: hypothetical protein VK630_04210 [Reyranella sp.]|nr:hypothetical protein [Reyranella sp.]
MKKIDDMQVDNASMAVRLTITKEDIAKGARRNANSCAIVQAALRQTKATAGKAHRNVCYLMIGGKWLRFKVPAYLRIEQIAFDRGGRFWPGDYVLEPVPTRALLALPKRAPSSPGAPKRRREKRTFHRLEGVRDTAHRND